MAEASESNVASRPTSRDAATKLSPITDGKRPLPINTNKDDRPSSGTSGFSKVGGARAINTPVAPMHVDRRFWPRDMRGLLEIYEQGYTLQEGMKVHAKSTTDALDLLTGECGNTVKVLMNQMENILVEIQKQVDRPANVDWTLVTTALAKIDRIQPENIGRDVDKRLEEHRSFMDEAERRIEEKLAAQIRAMDDHQQDREDRQREELEAVRQEQLSTRKSVTSMGDVVRKTENQLIEALGNQHQALKADFAQTVQDVLRVQEKKRRQDMDSVEPLLEAQLDRLMGQHHQALTSSVSSNIDDVLQAQREQGKCIADIEPSFKSELAKQFDETRQADEGTRSQMSEIHKTVHDDVGHLFSEIALIQRALNLDYVARPKRVHALRENSGSRLREFWTQTEAPPVKESNSQTDEAYFKHLKRQQEKAKQAKAKPKAMVAEVKPVLKKKSGYADQEKKKQKMREALIKPSYNVTSLYHTTGLAQRIARSSRFENFTFLVILLNALWIAVDTDHNDAVVLLDAHLIFQVTENIFCSYFTAELLIRFMAFRRKRSCLRDVWFMFDTILVLGMVIETWIITAILLAVSGGSSSATEGLGSFSIFRMARLVKILRMARLARLLRMVPELVVILKSIGAAFRSVGFFLLLAVIIIYVYAVGFRQMTKGSDVGDQYFKSVPKAMNSLLLEGMLPLYAILVRDVSRANAVYWPLIMTFILLASVTVMNMLVGVLVEVVRTVAERERESMTVIHVTNELREVMANFINDKAKAPESVAHPRSSNLGASIGKVLHRGESESVAPRPTTRDRGASRTLIGDIPDMSKETFGEFLGASPVVALLQDCGVDALALLDSVDMIFEEKVKDGSRGLRFVDFVEVVLNMRGTNPATVKDVKEQMRLLKVATGESAARTNKIFESTLAKLRVDILMQLNELRRLVDSDCGSEGEASMMHPWSYHHGKHSPQEHHEEEEEEEHADEHSESGPMPLTPTSQTLLSHSGTDTDQFGS